MQDAGLPVELLETRHVRDAFKAMPVKTDRKDARGIAQLMRLGWFRPAHCKSIRPTEFWLKGIDRSKARDRRNVTRAARAGEAPLYGVMSDATD